MSNPKDAIDAITRRDFLNSASAIAAATSVGSLFSVGTADAQTSDLYGYAQMYSAGYADPLTVTNATETLRVWVQSGKSYAFRIARVSLATSSLLRETPVFEGSAGTTTSSDSARGLWNSYGSFATTSWPDGLYAIDVGPDGVLNPINTSVASALCVVRRGIAASGILYKLPTNTWNAYGRMPWIPIGAPGYGGHVVESRSFYENRAESASWVPYHRPGIGINGDQISGWIISPVTGAHTLFEGHNTFLPWLIASFGDIDFCTDLDLHKATAIEMLSRYRLLICAGHDEYWTSSMRAHVASHVNSGRNVAFLGGNNLYWNAQIQEVPGTSPPSTLFNLSVDKQPLNNSHGGWPANEARLTGLSGRGDGGWVPSNIVPLVFDATVTYSWIRHGLTSMQLPAGGGALIGYEFDNVHASTPPDYVEAATTGPNITAYSGANFNVLTSGLSAALCYFQPFGGVVNAGTTEWIKFASADAAGTGQATRNIVRTLSSDRHLVSVGSFSRLAGFDIVYFNQVELPGDATDSCISSFWMLDVTAASPHVERGKWLSVRQIAPGFTPRAFGRNAAGAARMFHQNGAGEISIWHIAMTSTDSTTLRALVSTGAICFTTDWTLVGAGLISGSAELDLVLVSPGQVRIQAMGGSLGEVAVAATTMNVPLAGATYLAFGSVPFSGNHAPAIAFVVDDTRIVIFRITMAGLVVVADTSVSGLIGATQLGGFADLNADGYPELVVSHDHFTVGISSGVQSGIPLDLSATALSELTPKAGFEHDS